MKEILKLPKDVDYTKVKLTADEYSHRLQKIIFSLEEEIIAEIAFTHQQDCCEQVYADVLEFDRDFMETNELTDTNYMKKNEITIEFVDGYGVRLGGKPIPCYNIQNGYYFSELSLETFGFNSYLYIEDIPKVDDIW